ncbi:MAG: hypothetical protein ACI4QR_04570, partial [Eubacteriales bacterium]
MKNKRYIFLLLIFFIFLFSPVSYAADAEYKEAEISSADIPEEISKYIPQEILDSSAEDFSSVFTLNGAIKTIILIAGDTFPEAMSAFLFLLGLVVISSVIHAFKGAVASESFGYVLEFVSVLCIASATFSFVKLLFEDFSEFISQVNAFMLSVIPSLSALAAAGGEITSSVVFGSVLASVISLLQILCTS